MMSASEQPKNDAGQEPDEGNDGQRLRHPADGAQEVPLFLRGRSDGQRGDAQDEKDEVGE
jgi:hypothetical protein